MGSSTQVPATCASSHVRAHRLQSAYLLEREMEVRWQRRADCDVEKKKVAVRLDEVENKLSEPRRGKPINRRPVEMG